MDLLLVLLLAGLALYLAGVAAAWMLFVLVAVLMAVLAILSAPFHRVKDPCKRGRALKRAVLLGTLPRA